MTVILYFSVCYLFPPVDDVLGEGETALRRPARHRVVAGGGVRHLHGAQQHEGAAEADAAQQQLAVARVAAALLVRRTPGAAANAVHVLIALGGVLRKVDARAEHATWKIHNIIRDVDRNRQ